MVGSNFPNSLSLDTDTNGKQHTKQNLRTEEIQIDNAYVSPYVGQLARPLNVPETGGVSIAKMLCVVLAQLCKE